MSRRLVTVARYDIPPKAYMAINALEDAGIRCVLQDEQLVAMDYLLNLAVGGIKVQVWEEDAERAAALLESIERGHGRTPGEEETNRGDEAVIVQQSRGTAPEEVAGQPPANETRDRYARRAALAALCSILIAPVALYTAYLLLMTAFTEGRLTGDRWLGVLVAAILTPVAMLLSPMWVFMMFSFLNG